MNLISALFCLIIEVANRVEKILQKTRCCINGRWVLFSYDAPSCTCASLMSKRHSLLFVFNNYCIVTSLGRYSVSFQAQDRFAYILEDYRR